MRCFISPFSESDVDAHVSIFFRSVRVYAADLSAHVMQRFRTRIMDVQLITKLEEVLSNAKKRLKGTYSQNTCRKSFDISDSYVWDLFKLIRFSSVYLDSLPIQNTNSNRSRNSTKMFSLPFSMSVPKFLISSYLADKEQFSQLVNGLMYTENRNIFVQDITVERDVLQKEVVDQSRELRKLQRNCADLLGKYQTCQFDSAKLVSQLRKCQSNQVNTNDVLHMQLEDSKVQIQRLLSECRNLKQVNDQLKIQNNSLMDGNVRLQQKLESLEEERATLRESFSRRRKRTTPQLLTPQEESDRLLWRRTNTTQDGKVKCYCGQDLMWRVARSHWKNYQDHGRCTLTRVRVIPPET